jgi:hypothetical protein
MTLDGGRYYEIIPGHHYHLLLHVILHGWMNYQSIYLQLGRGRSQISFPGRSTELPVHAQIFFGAHLVSFRVPTDKSLTAAKHIAHF